MTIMIRKELRFMGRLFRQSSPSVGRFRFMHKLMGFLKGRNIKGLHCDEQWIEGRDKHPIRLRIYRPEAQEKTLPVLLYLHGGGYAIGTPEIAHARIKDFISTRACVVVAPDYRKSLEAPYPAALHDAYDTLLWIKANADSLDICNDQIMVGGHSAGGGLTAALCLFARDKGEVNIAFQMPIYPMIDDRMDKPSAVNNTAPLWNSKANEIAWGLYLKATHEAGEEVPIYAAPSRAQDYTKLPPALTFVGDIEPFKDETIDFVEKLKQAGVPVSFALYEGCYHGFETVVPKAAISREARRFLLDGFAHAVDHYKAAQTS